MDVEADQSGKVEDTKVDTSIAFSDRKSKSILIDRREKRELKKIFRENNRGYVLRMIREHRSFDKRDIVFTKVGRKTKAHQLAINVYRGHVKPDIVVTKKDIIPFI